MVGIMIITHGNLAKELLEAAKIIVGSVERTIGVSIGWDDDVQQAREKVEKAMKKVTDGEGVVILTDMFGGTPTNISLSFLTQGKVEVVTGVNLPMVIKTLHLQKEKLGLREMAHQVQENGRKSIYVATEILSTEIKK
jgi:PTS system mannose-specific IIA component